MGPLLLLLVADWEVVADWEADWEVPEGEHNVRTQDHHPALKDYHPALKDHPGEQYQY